MMPDQDTVEFVARNIELTLQDPTMSPWQKLRFILWLIYVTSPQTPRFIF